jgi:hypothetical protein
MKNMRKIGFIFLSLAALALTACKGAWPIASGRYYLEGDVTVYIEIVDGDKLYFTNYDFTQIEAELREAGLPFDVDIASNVEPKIYKDDYAKGEFFVKIGGGGSSALNLTYSAADKTIRFGDDIFNLK